MRIETTDERLADQRALEISRMRIRVNIQDVGDQETAEDPRVRNGSLAEHRREKDKRVSGRGKREKFISERFNYDHK